jgi:hypothetical protein
MRIELFAQRYGCSVAMCEQLRSMHVVWRRTPLGEFVAHRADAKRRGIAWELTLAEWWEIWDRSGKYPQRGKETGQYCMARRWDFGPYAAHNVEIQTVSANHATRVQRRRFKRRASKKRSHWLEKDHHQDFLDSIGLD